MKKLLVANRGEIAVRIFRTCRRLGIATVAVAPPDDRGALHARSADEVVEIAAYLDADEHVRAAAGDAVPTRSTRATASSPRAPTFAERGRGGRARLRRADGTRRFASAATSSPRRRSPAGPAFRSCRTASRTRSAFPLVVKAAAGGGGRGMRVVRDADGARGCARRGPPGGRGGVRRRPRLLRALRRAAEARRDPAPRGRRRQRRRTRRARVLDPAPPPEGARGVARRRRSTTSCGRRSSDAAVAFAEAVGYRSAGTAEFMVDGRDFWFLELNGRIQVEHPVTELVTGVDLVEQQLRIAAGEQLANGRLRAERATRSRCACTRRIRGRSCRRPAASRGCAFPTAFASTRGSRRATRSASPTTR